MNWLVPVTYWTLLALGNLFGFLLIHLRFFTDHVDSTASLLWKVFFGVQIISVLLYLFVSTSGVECIKPSLLKFFLVFMLLLSFLIEPVLKSYGSWQIRNDVGSLHLKTVSVLQSFEAEVAKHRSNTGHYSSQQSLEFVLFVMSADLRYRGLPDFSARAFAVLEKALTVGMIDPNISVDYWIGTNKERLIKVPLFSYYFLVRSPVRPEEAPQILKLITLMKEFGADPNWRDFNGQRIGDYEEFLRKLIFNKQK